MKDVRIGKYIELKIHAKTIETASPVTEIYQFKVAKQ